MLGTAVSIIDLATRQVERTVQLSAEPYSALVPADGKQVFISLWGRSKRSWLKEFQEFERSGNLPRLSIIRLGNDHTSGTRPGSRAPRAFVAENDAALGRLVEAVSRRCFWNESAIFVLEDDAQNGPDHVDAHRSPAPVISRFAKRRAVDSTLYTTSGMLRTMELIPRLEPM